MRLIIANACLCKFVCITQVKGDILQYDVLILLIIRMHCDYTNTEQKLCRFFKYNITNDKLSLVILCKTPT